MSLGQAIIEFRFSAAEAYLAELAAANDARWSAELWFTRYETLTGEGPGNDPAALGRALALVNPKWTEPHLSPLGREALYGKPSFDRADGQPECESNLLWGYTCPFTRAARHSDHLFPASLGGPTFDANRLTLCAWHNTAKSCDVHLFPWEFGIPPWFSGLTREIRSELRLNSPVW